MATKVIVTGGTSSSPESFTVASSADIYGAATGYQKVLINSGVSGVKLDANIEAIHLSNNLSSYTFQAVTGQGFVIKDSVSQTVATLGSINQNVKIIFSDNITTTLSQTGSTAFTLNGVTVATAISTGFTTSSLGYTVSLTADAATNNLSFGVRFAPGQDITIAGAGTQLAGLAPRVHDLGGNSITLDASDNTVSLSLNQASDTIAFGGVKFAANDVVSVGTATNDGDVPISLAAALVDIGTIAPGPSYGTRITLDQNVGMTGSAQGSAGAVDAANEWYFDTSTHHLTYYSSGAKTITLVGVSSVSVSGGDMTMTLGSS